MNNYIGMELIPVNNFCERIKKTILQRIAFPHLCKYWEIPNQEYIIIHNHIYAHPEIIKKIIQAIKNKDLLNEKDI